MSASAITASSTLASKSSMFSEEVCSMIPQSYLKDIELQNKLHGLGK